MKRIVFLAVLAASSISIIADSARAAGSNNSGPVMAQQANGGIFSRLMELERRKNAALRRIFLGK